MQRVKSLAATLILFTGGLKHIEEELLPVTRKSFEISVQQAWKPGSTFQFLRRTYGLMVKITPGKYAETMTET